MSPLGKSSDHHKEVIELELLADHYDGKVEQAVEDFTNLSRSEIVEVLTKELTRREWMRTKGAALQNQSEET